MMKQNTVIVLFIMFISYQDQQTKQNQGIIDSSQSLSNDNNASDESEDEDEVFDFHYT